MCNLNTDWLFDDARELFIFLDKIMELFILLKTFFIFFRNISKHLQIKWHNVQDLHQNNM